MSDEPQYVDAGNEFGDNDPHAIPKNRTPTTDFQRKVLAIFGRKYFKDKQEKSDLRQIEKSMAPLALNVTRPPKYPTEYVEQLIVWAQKMRRTKQLPLFALINAIKNEARRDEWVAKHQQELASKPQSEPYAPTVGTFRIVMRNGQEFVIDEHTNLDTPEDTNPTA